MICTVLIVSFVLESIFTNIVSTDSILIPLFTITSFILIYPYFRKKNTNYIIVCLIIGLLYDIKDPNEVKIILETLKKEHSKG